jgi:hypothetical protein
MKFTAQQRLAAIQELRKQIRDNSTKITEGQFSASREFGRLFGNAHCRRQITIIQQKGQKEWGAGWEKRAPEIDAKEASEYAAIKKEADAFWAKILG